VSDKKDDWRRAQFEKAGLPYEPPDSDGGDLVADIGLAADAIGIVLTEVAKRLKTPPAVEEIEEEPEPEPPKPLQRLVIEPPKAKAKLRRPVIEKPKRNLPRLRLEKRE